MLERLNPDRWPIAWDQLASAAGVAAVGIAVALAVHYAVFAVLFRLSRRSATPVDEMVYERLYRPVRWSLVAAAVSLAAQTEPPVAVVWGWIAQFAVPGLLGWIAYSLVKAFAAALEYKSGLHIDEVAARSHRTRISIFSRTAIFVVVFITVGLMLLGIPGVRDVGTTLLASAGLAALAVGAAAQPALKSLIAGLQMALTEPIRIGDMVVVDGHTGRVEEIRMSFATVRTWDERVIIVPTSRFLDESFENWSRRSEALTGPVFLHLDPATAVAPIRAEFERYIATRTEWDTRKAELLMTEAHPESIELRMTMSSATIGDLWTLRCAVREHMIEWLRAEMPGALIRHRLEVEAANARAEGG